MSDLGDVSTTSLNSCLNEYWYLWTFTSIGIVLMTCIDSVVTFILLKKFFRTPKIGPKKFINPSNEIDPSFQSSSDSTGKHSYNYRIRHNSSSGRNSISSARSIDPIIKNTTPRVSMPASFIPPAPLQ